MPDATESVASRVDNVRYTGPYGRFMHSANARGNTSFTFAAVILRRVLCKRLIGFQERQSLVRMTCRPNRRITAPKSPRVVPDQDKNC